MNPVFRFYTPDDADAVRALILRSYSYAMPAFGVARHEFSGWYHPGYLAVDGCWRTTAGLWEADGAIVACAINENAYQGDAFFVFDSRERAQDAQLVTRMLDHAIHYMARCDESTGERIVELRIPDTMSGLQRLAELHGFRYTSDHEACDVLPFAGKPLPVSLPDGYRIADGQEIPAFYQGLVHNLAFQSDLPYAGREERAMLGLRSSPLYQPALDLCALDAEGKPVGMAILWYMEGMPICELEPMGVVWWERRRGIGEALLHEGANRVMARWPSCRGMLGGSQPFYWALGFKTEAIHRIWRWQKQVRAPRGHGGQG